MSRLSITGCILVVSALSSAMIGCGGGSSNAPTPATPTTPAAPAAPAVCATFYADADLQGASLVSMGPADDSPTIPAAFNDTMSSVAVTSGCTVIAYPDANYGGQAATFTQTAQSVPAAINDQMSSYKCTCNATP